MYVLVYCDGVTKREDQKQIRNVQRFSDRWLST